jgi:hypothetical protein
MTETINKSSLVLARWREVLGGMLSSMLVGSWLGSLAACDLFWQPDDARPDRPYPDLLRA